MPPPPPPPRNNNVAGDSADAFFNDFQQPSSTSSIGTAVPSVRQRGTGPPLQPRPPGGGAPLPQQQDTRLPVGAAKQPRPPPRPTHQQQPQAVAHEQFAPLNPVVPQQQQPSNSYYNNSSNYGTTPLVQQPPSQVAPAYQNPHVTEEQSNDWYTPSTTDNSNSNDYGMVQPQYQPYSHSISTPTATTSTTNTPYNNYSNPSQAYFNGPMDTSGRDNTGYSAPQTFVPQQLPNAAMAPSGDISGFMYETEAPLLEELGVNWEHIMMKTKAVVVPFRRFQKHSALADPSIIVEDADLAGPLAYALLLGGELLITGKLQFGYIYGFGLFGCLAMTLILNLMSTTSISFWTVTSILGYALIPVNILAAIKIILFSFGTLVQLLALFTVLWSTTASTRLLEIGFGLTDQRYLLAYPIALLYSAFVLITIF